MLVRCCLSRVVCRASGSVRFGSGLVLVRAVRFPLPGSFRRLGLADLLPPALPCVALPPLPSPSLVWFGLVFLGCGGSKAGTGCCSWGFSCSVRAVRVFVRLRQVRFGSFVYGCARSLMFAAPSPTTKVKTIFQSLTQPARVGAAQIIFAYPGMGFLPLYDADRLLHCSLWRGGFARSSVW